MSASSAAFAVADRGAVVGTLRDLVRPRRNLLVLAGALFAGTAAAGLLTPMLLGVIVDRVLAGEPAAAVTAPAVAIAIAGVAQGLLATAAPAAAAHATEPALADLRETVLARALHLPIDVVERIGTGDLVAHTDSDVEAVTEAVDRVLPEMLHAFAGTLADDLRLVARDADADATPHRPRRRRRRRLGRCAARRSGHRVGEGGHQLTATQAQHLAPARLLLADPAVGVLDEATAETGSAGARMLEQASDAALAGRTAVVVAHRLSQAARADRIVVRDHGEIAEEGTHESCSEPAAPTPGSGASGPGRADPRRSGDRGTHTGASIRLTNHVLLGLPNMMNRWKMKLFAVLLAALLGLAACGGDDDAAGDTAAGDASSSDTAAEDDASERTVEHAMGSTEVPAEPERVVVLDSSFLDAALALGITPVGATEAEARAGMPGYLADQVPDVEVVGLTDEPNVEAIAALRPDLILGAKVRHEALYDRLSEVAPTVFTESSGTNWKDGFTVTADALGAAEEAEEYLAEYEARADEIGERIGAEGTHLSMVRFLLPDEIRLYGPETFSGTVLTDVGFDLGDHEWDEYSMAYLSAEQLEMADADVIFASSYGGRESQEFLSAFGAIEQIWSSVPAVAEGRQHWVDDDVWMLGIGPLGAQQILDDLEAVLGA